MLVLSFFSPDKINTKALFLVVLKHKRLNFACGHADKLSMKTPLLFIFLSLSPFVIAQDQCNINNYKDFIYKPGVHRCDLRGADLREVDLTGAYLSYSDLSGADLTGAKLDNAKFFRANLEKAKLIRTTAVRADFRESKSQGTVFTNSELRHTNFDQADLRDAHLINTNVHGSKFTNADLSGADISRMNLNWSTLLNLNGANFQNTKVSEPHVDFLKRKGVSGFLVKEYWHEEYQCSYTLEPVYIKQKGCGGTCSGTAKCKLKTTEGSELVFLQQVACGSKGDECPSANDCLKDDDVGQSWAIFMGTPSEFKTKYKEVEDGIKKGPESIFVFPTKDTQSGATK